ncbi:DUF3800 domain-containing protein [Azospirillum sp. TSH64]|uniref:DUF3800 domain-containing protein n=1 Tax=Azospirillum sp. TSH64 TaxID=652740 RepID=UPI000D6089E3|nr:DUF3800 domain-containing protein [Azospirillum sp. TSH64]PWC74474.1 hypothetical protein TSH64_05345 [Azospirillum sp. TSH64]
MKANRIAFFGDEILSQTDSDFSDFIVFVDESGDHNLTSINPEFPLFALAFCILRKTDYATKVAPALDSLKFDTFGHDLTVLHSRDIRKQQGDFAVLRDAGRRTAFLDGLSAVIEEAPFTLCVTAIDKIRHKQKYKNPYNPYHLSLEYCLERTYPFLIAQGQQGKRTHIIAESRGKAEDRDLELQFRRILDEYEDWDHHFELRFASKACNSVGLQLADLAAHPVARHVLAPDQFNRAFGIVEKKLMTDGLTGMARLNRPTSRVKGYEGIGLKIFP